MQRTTRLPPLPRTVRVESRPYVPRMLVDQVVGDDPDVRLDATEAIRANGKRGVTSLIARFRSKDPKTRLRVARALERLREDAEFAVPALAEVLRTDPDTNVRLAVLRALKAIGRNAQEAVPALISVLEKEDDELAAAAAEALAFVGPGASAAVPALIAALSRRRVALDALLALQEIGTAAKAAVPHLIEILQTHDEDLHYRVASALGGIGESAAAAVPLLAELLVERARAEQECTWVRLALVKIGEPALPALMDLLGHVDVANQVDSALRRMGTKAVPALRRALDHEDWEARVWALISLSHILNPRLAGVYAASEWREKLFPKIVQLSRHPQGEVREVIARVLESYGERAVPHLVVLLEDSNPDTRYRAVESLGHIHSHARPAVPALIKLLDDDYLGSVASEALKKIEPRDPAQVPSLVRALRNRDKDIRNAMGSILAQMGAADALRLALRDTDAAVRAAAAHALGEIKNEDDTVLAGLLDALGDADPLVRASAGAALARKNRAPQRVIPILVAALAAESDDVFAAATNGLASYGAEARTAFPALLKTASKRKYLSYESRNALQKALYEIGKHDVARLGQGLELQGLVGESAAWALARIEDEAIPPTIEATRSRFPQVRRWAIEILGRIGEGDERVRETLVERIRLEQAPLLRLMAAEALWDTHFDARSVVPILLGVLKSGNEDQRESAGLYLRAIGARAYFAEDDLRKVLEEVPNDVKPYVAGVLKVIEEE